MVLSASDLPNATGQRASELARQAYSKERSARRCNSRRSSTELDPSSCFSRTSSTGTVRPGSGRQASSWQARWPRHRRRASNGSQRFIGRGRATTFGHRTSTAACLLIMPEARRRRATNDRKGLGIFLSHLVGSVLSTSCWDIGAKRSTGSEQMASWFSG